MEGKIKNKKLAKLQSELIDEIVNSIEHIDMEESVNDRAAIVLAEIESVVLSDMSESEKISEVCELISEHKNKNSYLYYM